MFKKRLDRHYVSELDQFLVGFDADHPKKSASQQAEIDKSANVSEMRDNAFYQDASEKLWDDF